MSNHFEGKSDSEKWLMYVTAVKQRDEARKLADYHEAKRRHNWRLFYGLEKSIKEMDVELGLNDVVRNMEEEESKVMEPAAPRKRKRKIEELSKLTKTLDLTSDDE